MAGAIYLADTTIYVLKDQFEQVGRRFETLLLEGRLASCQVTALEYLNNAPDPRRYEQMWAAVHGQRWIDVSAEAMTRAMTVHRQLARTSQHRLFSLPDLMIAAAAELSGATVLHYDDDYDRIAAVTGQEVEWVVPRGSL